MNFNICVFSGRLGADPKLEYTQGGTARASFRLAVNTGYGDKQRTEWVQIIAWGKTAEAAGQHLGKGDGALVQAEYRLNEWEGKDGQKHSRPEFHARQVEFLSRRGAATTTAEEPQGYRDAPKPKTDPAYPDDDIPF